MNIDAKLNMLQTHIIRDWLQNKANLEPILGGHRTTGNDLAIIANVAMRGK